MKKTIVLLGVLAMTLFRPIAAMANDVPEVSWEEYRYYLYDHAWDNIGRGEYAYYTENELKLMLNEKLAESNSSYMQMVREELQTDFNYTIDQLQQYTDNELEQILAYNYIEQQRHDMVKTIYDYYDTEINTESFTMLELLGIYYQVVLEQDYNVVAEFDNTMTGHDIRLFYDRAIVIYSLQDTHGKDFDYDAYTLEKLRDMRKWDVYSEQLRSKYNVTEDLSGYTGTELEVLASKYRIANTLKTIYNIEVNIADYSLFELESWNERLSHEKELRSMGITTDLSGYNNEEVKRLWLETALQNTAKNHENLSQYTTDKLYDLYIASLTSDILEKVKAEKEAKEKAEAEAKAKKLRIRVNGELMYLPEADKQYTPIGYAYISEAPVMMINDRAFLPYEVMFEALGAEAVLDENTDTITAEKNGVRAVFDKVSGKVVMTDTYTYVQLRSAAEAFGATATWTAVPHEINIRY